MNTRTLLTAFLLACAGAWSSLGDARVEVGEMAVKTYPFGAPDPVPATATTRYPYFRYDGSSVDGAGAVGSMPWAALADKITKLDKDEGVTGLGDVVATLPALTTINGLTLDELASMGMLGAAKAGFSAIAVEGGVAQLGVVVSTNGDLTAAAESWGKAKVEDVGLDKETGEAILTIPAPADKGFFIVAPATDVQHD